MPCGQGVSNDRVDQEKFTQREEKDWQLQCITGMSLILDGGCLAKVF
jgi:hypothetical protein